METPLAEGCVALGGKYLTSGNHISTMASEILLLLPKNCVEVEMAMAFVANISH